MQSPRTPGHFVCPLHGWRRQSSHWRCSQTCSCKRDGQNPRNTLYNRYMFLYYSSEMIVGQGTYNSFIPYGPTRWWRGVVGGWGGEEEKPLRPWWWEWWWPLLLPAGAVMFWKLMSVCVALSVQSGIVTRATEDSEELPVLLVPHPNGPKGMKRWRIWKHGRRLRLNLSLSSKRGSGSLSDGFFFNSMDLLSWPADLTFEEHSTHLLKVKVIYLSLWRGTPLHTTKRVPCIYCNPSP